MSTNLLLLNLQLSNQRQLLSARAGVCLENFIYSLVELLHLKRKKTTAASIYKKYDIEQILCYQVLTETDSTSIQFIFESDPANKSDEFGGALMFKLPKNQLFK